MKQNKLIIILAAVIVALLLYIALKPTPHVVDPRVLELKSEVDSLNRMNRENILKMDELKKGIVSKDAEIKDLKVKGEIIHEVYIDKIDSIKFIGIDGNIKLFSRLISQKDSI